MFVCLFCVDDPDLFDVYALHGSCSGGCTRSLALGCCYRVWWTGHPVTVLYIVHSMTGAVGLVRHIQAYIQAYII